jgi:hypothetical protein
MDLIHWHDIFSAQAAGVAKRERRAFDRTPDRAPDVDFGEAILEQTVGLVRQKVADAART